MHRALGQPPIMLVDNWPAVPPMVVIASHEVAEQVSKPSNTFQYSAPKSWLVDRLVDLIGSKSIMFKQVEAQIPATNIHCANGNRKNDEWKAVRKRFNPGFAPQHLMTLLPVIVEKAGPYLKIIDDFSSTGETFSFDEITTNLTFDIIGAVSMDEDMDAQHKDPSHQGELIRTLKQLTKSVFTIHDYNILNLCQ